MLNNIYRIGGDCNCEAMDIVAKCPTCDSLIHLVWVCTEVYQQTGSLRVWEEDAVDGKPSTVAHHYGRLFYDASKVEGVKDDLCRCFRRAHNFEKRHHMRRRKEMRAHDAVERLRNLRWCDEVSDVENKKRNTKLSILSDIKRHLWMHVWYEWLGCQKRIRVCKTKQNHPHNLPFVR
jgi:hypothetical protein